MVDRHRDRRATTRRRVDLVVQTTLVTAAALLYFLVRGLREGNVQRAEANARWILRLEARLGIDIEMWIQDLVLDHAALVTLSNWVYIWGHWPVLIVTLYGLHRWRPHHFTLLRNALFVTGAVGLMIYVTVPVAPPRLLDADYRDTVTELSSSYRVLQPPALVNKFAAMPSLHAGWNLLAGLAVYRATRRGDLRLIAAIGPAAMALAVVSTGNHFVLDVIAGEMLAGLGWIAACRWAVRTGRSPSAAPTGAVSAQHDESPQESTLATGRSTMRPRSRVERGSGSR